MRLVDHEQALEASLLPVYSLQETNHVKFEAESVQLNVSPPEAKPVQLQRQENRLWLVVIKVHGKVHRAFLPQPAEDALKVLLVVAPQDRSQDVVKDKGPRGVAPGLGYQEYRPQNKGVQDGAGGVHPASRAVACKQTVELCNKTAEVEGPPRIPRLVRLQRGI